MFNQSGLFFVPRKWQTAKLIKWLKRVHAWAGFWGALFFLLLGTSGFLLNHRAQMKIDTGEPVEIASVELPVAPGTIPDAEGLGEWARTALHMPVKAAAPRDGGKAPKANKPGAGETRFMGRAVEPAATWTRVFTMPDARVTVSYVPGANHVTARREEQGALNVIKNLHKGVGLPIAWVLLIDTIAGALVTMALTGFLLWSRLHGPRLLAGGLAGGSLLWGLIAAGSSLG